MKKGFTLVELLAVITVLAIITVIAVPTVSRSIQNSKQKSHDIQIKKMKEMFQSYLSQISEDEGDELYEDYDHRGVNWRCSNNKDTDGVLLYLKGYLILDPSFLVEKGYLENSKIIDPLTGEEFAGKFAIYRDCCPYKYKIIYYDYCEEREAS